MKISVLGAGAIGSMFGGLLKQRDPQLIFGKDAFRNQDLAEGAVLRGSDTHSVQRGSGCNSAKRFFTCARSNAAGRLLAASSASM